jgi:hypothetical protein
MKNKPAFPTDYNFSEEYKDGSFQTGNTIAHMPGMSTRQLVGAMALQGLLSNHDFLGVKGTAKMALECADEFLKMEEETRL